MYGLGSRGGTPGGRFGGAFPEEAAELRVEEVAEEGTVDDVAETEIEAGAADCAPREAALRPIAKVLTGPWPEGVETVAGPTEEA